MTPFKTEDSARPWGGTCEDFGASYGAKPAMLYLILTLQKRPPVGRVGRCPGKLGGVCYD
jgi:hypothetical protein